MRPARLFVPRREGRSARRRHHKEKNRRKVPKQPADCASTPRRRTDFPANKADGVSRVVEVTKPTAAVVRVPVTTTVIGAAFSSREVTSTAAVAGPRYMIEPIEMPV